LWWSPRRNRTGDPILTIGGRPVRRTTRHLAPLYRTTSGWPYRRSRHGVLRGGPRRGCWQISGTQPGRSRQAAVYKTAADRPRSPAECCPCRSGRMHCPASALQSARVVAGGMTSRMTGRPTPGLTDGAFAEPTPRDRLALGSTPTERQQLHRSERQPLPGPGIAPSRCSRGLPAVARRLMSASMRRAMM
jgi:hypothetical protein